MKWKSWDPIPLTIPDPARHGADIIVDAIAPLIVSASRSTDIPAFYGDWFMERLRAGYVKWKSPFGGNPVYVSFAKTRVFAFWSKNPAPFLPHLETLDRKGYRYYFLFTLNDYDAESLEPNVPPVDERIETFIRLSRRIGKGRVVWRFDPLVLSDRITVEDLLEKVRYIGDQIAPFTERLVFSFVDVEKYAKVQRNLRAGGVPVPGNSRMGKLPGSAPGLPCSTGSGDLLSVPVRKRGISCVTALGGGSVSVMTCWQRNSAMMTR